jgi:RNA polymerase sigma-70 factor (ECF subfamily)
MSGPSMQDLAARLARGEEAAFAQRYDAYANRLHRYLSVRLGSWDAAADVVQSTFLRAVKGRWRFHKVEDPVAYLFQIARNEAARFLGSQRRQIEHSLPVDELLTDDVGAVDEAEMVAAALKRLDADDRELVELRIYAGLTFREIADVTDQPQGSVATRYRRALESLRRWLAQQLR